MGNLVFTDQLALLSLVFNCFNLAIGFLNTSPSRYGLLGFLFSGWVFILIHRSSVYPILLRMYSVLLEGNSRSFSLSVVVLSSWLCRSA